tara:strand:+ start:8561 stop:8686 length:126 start_codon:yes stop_codon:yes gene_type:complete
MKQKSPFKYERIRFYNEREGKYQFLMIASIGKRVVKYRFEK